MKATGLLMRATVCCGMLINCSVPASAAELTADVVLRSISGGTRYLTSRQRPDGSWTGDPDEVEGGHVVGVTGLVTLALLNCGLTHRDPAVRRALGYLRGQPAGQPDKTYEVSLMLMALATAKDPTHSDAARIAALTQWLEQAQSTGGGRAGGWSYGKTPLGGDPSNSQFAILALHEASEYGVPVDRRVWQRAKDYWESLQNADGGWDYGGGQRSTGSMTVAGVSSLAIIEQHLREDKNVAPDGTPPCCEPDEGNPPLERGIRWLGNHFAVGHNPGNSGWLLYYLYGVERAGRLSGRRFFGDHDWYREGAAFLVKNQNPRDFTWRGVGIYENRPIIGTALPLLFLSKGLSPVLMSKLKHGTRDRARPVEVVGNDWNQHNRDIRNLCSHISGLPRWPALVTTQEVDLLKAKQTSGVDALLQAPMLFISGSEPLKLQDEEKEILREYLLQGGFVLASPACQSAEFEDSLRALLLELLPPGEGELKLLTADHPVFRSEYLLQADGVPLYGVDVGCRTAVIFSPEDLGCLWSYWQRHDPPRRNPQLKIKVLRAMQIGVNIAAYATGREPPKSLDAPRKLQDDAELDAIERGLLQVVQLRHTGQWNAAPRALRNLLLALNETVGLAASPRPKDLTADDPSLFQYPLLYMHGRTRFTLTADERTQIKRHLARGGLLFADSCCGSAAFDKSFRELIAQMYPDQPLTPIPITHELFQEDVGHDIRRVKRRTVENAAANAPLSTATREVEPYLEGIEVDGRLVVIYSKYDISCALERQAALSCEGYIPEDAVKIAMNIVLYAMQQELRLPEFNP